jgi:hypothetical protein
MAKDAGIDVVAGYSDALNKTPMMNKVDTIRTKLVFNQDTRKIVGGSVLRKCIPAQSSPNNRYLTLTLSSLYLKVTVPIYFYYPCGTPKELDHTASNCISNRF